MGSEDGPKPSRVLSRVGIRLLHVNLQNADVVPYAKVAPYANVTQYVVYKNSEEVLNNLAPNLES